ncbi:hypothetical protein [Nocardioides sp. cx-173]|uniref:hypothetical protein n=1 Tax=Nocardioides sp. cx-173 TaxID=2898796 RepID=UPI001E456950|nr:hypothetical protein [Nocardioides sp. cx-173]MCD4525249.1 hypothetical protein [Nocardioides sp. cx-173]UGB40948.1 hypothetical protein LQ940_16420 [Nocardioides sp. cx-173]
MSTTAEVPIAITCPPWCGGDHLIDRDDGTHVADRGVWHNSAIVDTWTGVHADGPDPIVVRVQGYRHDNPDHPEGPDLSQWHDEVVVDGDVYPGFMSSVQLPAVDARRLGRALIAAADILEAQS